MDAKPVHSCGSHYTLFPVSLPSPPFCRYPDTTVTGRWLSACPLPWLKQMHLHRPDGECIATVCRICADDILATACHCIVEGGKCLEGLSAYGDDVTFIAAFSWFDVGLFRGPPGPPLSLATAGCVDGGVPVQLVAYPIAIDKESGRSDGPLSFSGGQICSCAGNGFLASVNYRYTTCEEQKCTPSELFQSSSSGMLWEISLLTFVVSFSPRIISLSPLQVRQKAAGVLLCSRRTGGWWACT